MAFLQALAFMATAVVVAAIIGLLAIPQSELDPETQTCGFECQEGWRPRP